MGIWLHPRTMPVACGYAILEGVQESFPHPWKKRSITWRIIIAGGSLEIPLWWSLKLYWKTCRRVGKYKMQCSENTKCSALHGDCCRLSKTLNKAPAEWVWKRPAPGLSRHLRAACAGVTKCWCFAGPSRRAQKLIYLAAPDFFPLGEGSRLSETDLPMEMSNSFLGEVFLHHLHYCISHGALGWSGLV